MKKYNPVANNILYGAVMISALLNGLDERYLTSFVEVLLLIIVLMARRKNKEWAALSRLERGAGLVIVVCMLGLGVLAIVSEWQ